MMSKSFIRPTKTLILVLNQTRAELPDVELVA